MEETVYQFYPTSCCKGAVRIFNTCYVAYDVAKMTEIKSEIKQVIIIRKDLKMGAGKFAI